jgi:cytochrome c-type biogenesis protein CcmH/NrfF
MRQDLIDSYRSTKLRQRNRSTFTRLSFELKRPRCRRGVLFLALASAAFAQTESQIESDEVKRVGSHLNCQCGGCNDNLNCMMSAGQCPYCKPSRKKIFKMQLGGMDDSSIVASFVQEVGYKVLRRDPSSLFWLVPYFSLGLGALLVAFNLMRMRSRVNSQALTRASAGGPSGPHDERLQFYLDTIEKIQPE